MPEMEEQVKTGVAQALADLGVTKETMSDLAKMKEIKRTEIGDKTTNVIVGEDQSLKFHGLGEQLHAIFKAATGQGVDQRLTKAATGMNEGIDSQGGFLLQPEVVAGIMNRANEIGQITSRCRKMTIGGQANTMVFNAIDETSRASNRWGGIIGYWVAEAGTKTPSHPKFRQMTLTLKKVIGAFYATDELLADVPALESLCMGGFSEEISFQVEDAIFNGNGVGKPLGITNSNCLVTVAKETAPAQAADTVLSENIFKMWSRLYAKSRANAVWLINQDIEPQLFGMYKMVGVSGVPVYLPAGGLSQAPYGTLLGRPVIPVEYCATLGDKNDIVLADFSQYVLADKGGVQSASSIHVAFLTDESVFRLVYRCDGQPLWSSALTPYKGSNTLSPFVTLAERA
jgi:HK97 family phage major capsid protein